MVPEFPNFAQLTAEHIEDIKGIVRTLPEYSDYNPASLVAWDVNRDTRISNLNGNLVVIFNDYLDGSEFISLHGTQDIKSSMRTVLQYAASHGLEPWLKLVPEETAMLALKTRDYIVSEDRDNYDYLISLENITKISGRQFRNLRRQIKTFVRNNGDGEQYVSLDLERPEHVNEILSVFTHRESQKPDNEDQSEKIAIQRLIQHREHFQLSVRGVRVQGQLEAFIIIEESSQNLVGHFWKANTQYAGIYHFLLHRCSEEFFARGFTEMNIEQDLGIKGLRLAKGLLRPRYLKKYNISGPSLVPQTVQEPVLQLALNLQTQYLLLEYAVCIYR